MDIKGLIEEVRKRPVLWDPKHKYYHHRNILATEWTNISLTLGIQKSVCKTKWKGLRDNYRKEMKKCLRRKKLDKNSSSTWVHFQALSFLKRVIDMNQLETTAKDDDDDGAGMAETSDYYELKDQSRLSDVEVISDDDSSNDLHDFMFNQNSQMDELDNMSDNAQEDYAVYPNSSSCNGGDDDLSPLTSGKKVDNFFESDDSDVHFFKSILPFLKQITNPTTKLKVRLEIQDIILSAISSSSEAEAKE